MSTFLAIGLGPIQTGIFLLGAGKGQFSRLVVAEVDNDLKNAVNSAGGKIDINIASADSVSYEIIPNVEVLNPLVDEDKKLLVQAAAEASEIATALPSVDFFPHIADYLREGFQQTPGKQRFVYTAENHNHAAECLEKAINRSFPNTYYLNTVIGKMSSVVTAEDCELRNQKPLCQNADRGHLVEEFNNILISNAPSIDERKVTGLIVKNDLYPFEEAKLYGHNAIHFLLASMGHDIGKLTMDQLVDCKDIMEFAKCAFLDECGKALCRKWDGSDELFTEKGFKEYADDLLLRMVNPFLQDSIPRILRDLPRKLSWEDRVVGTMRLAMKQGIKPEKLAKGAALSAVSLFGNDKAAIREGLAELWPKPWQNEHEQICNLIFMKD
jgi:mannitol-1-phosphate 5-dehydrogenase